MKSKSAAARGRRSRRSGRSSRSRARRCPPRRTAGPAPRSRGGGRARRAGRRSRRPIGFSARARRRRRTGHRRRRAGSAPRCRSRRRRSAAIGGWLSRSKHMAAGLQSVGVRQRSAQAGGRGAPRCAVRATLARSGRRPASTGAAADHVRDRPAAASNAARRYNPGRCRTPSSSEVRRLVASATPTGSAASRAGSPARARQGADLVVVVSAMGDTTDELLALAAAITDEPDPRELDMLLATGEHQSATLVSMALHALGVPAISLTGAQAGITTDGTLRPGAHRRTSTRPAIRAEMAAGRVVIVAGFQGTERGARPGAGRDHDPRPGRLGHDRRRPRGRASARPLPDLHRRPGHLHGRPADRARRPPAPA